MELNPIIPPVTKGDFTKDPLNLVPVPAVARKLHVKLLDNLEAAQAISEKSKYNSRPADGPWGIICNGVSYNYVADVVKELGIEDKTTILRIGFSYPLPEALIKDLLKRCEKILVVEEGEPFMEEAIKAFAQEDGLTIPINGKTEGLFSRLYEYHPVLVRECIAKYFGLSHTMVEAIRCIRCAGDSPASPHPLRRMFPSGHLLCRQEGRRGDGNHLSIGYRVLYPGIAPPAVHGGFFNLHGFIGGNRWWLFTSDG